MNSLKKTLFFSLTGLLLLCIFSENVLAIPLFARKYKVSCVMCHTGFPQLNSFGNAFASNGYQMPDEDTKDFVDEIEDGKLFLHEHFPFAIRVDSFYRARKDTDINLDIESPFSVKILTNGILAKDISYYFYFFFNERGGVTGIEDAFIYFNNAFKIDNFDVRMGQYQISDSIFPREQRLTFQDYTYYTVPVSNSGFNLVYDRGVEASYSIEATEDFGIGLLGGIANGNGINNSNAARNFDSDPYKNFYGRISFSYGNQGIGIYAYTGKEENTSKAVNEFYRIGPDFNFTVFGDWNIWGSYLYGEDENAIFAANGVGDINSWGGFTGVTHYLTDQWLLSLLHNVVEVDRKPQLDVNVFTVNFSYYLMRNLKFMFEGTADLKGKGPSHPQKTHTGEFGIVFAY
ncbi:MAG: hypothetical protein COV66_06820 [Nitrospinae bacterium CG11_big_fil_rev_8_21_14_0_20_45_15]|nr:MAG: hypothetical protein COV66_06820 [Nitrospinae bacterium CG11_big_fil_rev_8_21_14_0_20_45_15]